MNQNLGMIIPLGAGDIVDEAAKKVIAKYGEDKLKEVVKLNFKNTERILKKELVEVKNKEITDSINYAKRIQQSILTSDANFKKCTAEIFILWNPIL